MKPFAWSYSKYKAYDVCPKRHYEVDIAKHFTDDSTQLQWGNEVHAALAKAALRTEPLPESMVSYQHWIDQVITGSAAKIEVEQKYAMTKDFQPTSWFAPNVWFRGIADLLLINGSVALARDYKTGKMQHDSRQLMLMAQCIFVHKPEIKRIKTEFVWLKDNCVTPEFFNRDTIAREWPPLLPGIKAMEDAALTMTYPPKPGKLCARWCPVNSCPFWGKKN